MKIEALSPSSRLVTLKDGTSILYSYAVPVAVLTPGRGFLRTRRFHSRTTSKHIAQWLKDAPSTLVDQTEIDAIAEGK